ncbi:hypothetical protein [Limobrevibacterium gyesilva]|uniref:Yip1 domain-containing protein n=1 Tax=Limobrevibacterium gyesilva TaxID=2991712 RepID=A0AA41YSV4_9PROT|nr:hypothetical protein [Limobrevibacterium gyesilva]MCW3474837.1 hypothetical protein [Limobrevibacterium gyesilva]
MSAGLHVAVLLARGRSDALALLESAGDEMRTAARSFWAAALCLPAFLFLHLLDWAQQDATLAGGALQPARGVALDLMGYAVGWLGFALLSRRLAMMLGREQHWPRFITAWNWCNLIQYLMLVAAALPLLLGLPDWVTQTAWLVAMGWALWLEWFATRLTLDIPGVTAAGLVALDVALGLVLVGVTASLG